jgi:AraC-like DNA-binding protein
MWVAYRMTGQFREALDHLEAFSKGKAAILGENQQKQLNELTLSLKVREKDLTIANQQLELARKQRFQLAMFLIMIIIGLLVIGQFLYIVKTKMFRKTLFHKVEAADLYSQEMREWLEWKLSGNVASLPDKTENSAQSDNAETSELPDQTQQTLFMELREIFEKQKLYLDPELNLKTVIKLLGTNQKYLYQAMSGHSDDNFRTFLNRYRVDEAKRVIKEQVVSGNLLNLAELYTQAGFNSTASFYRAFRSVTGLTPKEYAAEIARGLR